MESNDCRQGSATPTRRERREQSSASSATFRGHLRTHNLQRLVPEDMRAEFHLGKYHTIHSKETACSRPIARDNIARGLALACCQSHLRPRPDLPACKKGTRQHHTYCQDLVTVGHTACASRTSPVAVRHGSHVTIDGPCQDPSSRLRIGQVCSPSLSYLHRSA